MATPLASSTLEAPTSGDDLERSGAMIVSQVMTKEVVSITPATSLKKAATIMLTRGISGLPVVEQGRVLGVLSETDILFKERGRRENHRFLDHLLRDPDAPPAAKLDARTAADAMTAPAVTISSGASVADAASLLLDLGIDRLPVVDGGRLVGIVTRTDLVRAFARSDQEIADEIRHDVVLRNAGGQPTGVTVAVERGQVLLEGHVKTDDAAENLVRSVCRVPGVVAVDARLSRPQRVTGRPITSGRTNR
jgi:CBS domain-containing protein